jgi:hypothetical protein
MYHDGCSIMDYPVLRVDNEVDDALKSRLYINGYSLPELSDRIPFEGFGFLDSLVINTGSGQYAVVYRTYANNAYITPNLHLGFGSEEDYASDRLQSFSDYMIEDQDPDVYVNSNESIQVDFGSASLSSSEPNKVIEFNFPTNSVFPPDSIEETIGKIQPSDTDDNYVGPNNLRLKKDSDGNYRIDTDYYENHRYLILSGPDDNFRCVYAGPYNLDLTYGNDFEYSWSTGDLYSELCEQDIYIRIGDSNYVKTNLRLC